MFTTPLLAYADTIPYCQYAKPPTAVQDNPANEQCYCAVYSCQYPYRDPLTRAQCMHGGPCQYEVSGTGVTVVGRCGGYFKCVAEYLLDANGNKLPLSEGTLPHASAPPPANTALLEQNTQSAEVTPVPKSYSGSPMEDPRFSNPFDGIPGRTSENQVGDLKTGENQYVSQDYTILPHKPPFVQIEQSGNLGDTDGSVRIADIEKKKPDEDIRTAYGNDSTFGQPLQQEDQNPSKGERPWYDPRAYLDSFSKQIGRWLWPNVSESGEALPDGVAQDGLFQNTTSSAYTPGAVDSSGRVDRQEGPWATSRPNLNGSFTPMTLDCYRLGQCAAVTLATKEPALYGQYYEIPSITYRSPIDGQVYTLTNVPGYVHDLCVGCTRSQHTQFDIPVGDFRPSAPSYTGRPWDAISARAFARTQPFSMTTSEWRVLPDGLSATPIKPITSLSSSWYALPAIPFVSNTLMLPQPESYFLVQHQM